METKWTAICIVGIIIAVNIGGICNDKFKSDVKVECYKAVAESVRQRVDPPKCD